MPNPGAFRSSRKDFLMGEKEAFRLAVEGNYTSEALALICRHYFKRYPIDLLHSTEPSAEHLAAVDDNAPDPEIEEPDIFALPWDKYKMAMRKVNQRKKDIEFRKNQIKRWMAYQYMKDHHVDPKEPGAHNPYRVLLCKLTGRGVERPRRKTPVNLWRKDKRELIELSIKRKHGTVPKEKLAALRSEVARDIFGKMDAESRHQWEIMAGEEHALAMEQWSRDMESPPSTDPADRQRSIQGLVSFVQPILDMICDATGWKATLIAGGPEPAQDGQLNVISVHSGTTPGDVKMTFGYAERANIKKYLVPMFGAFLQKCYSPSECRSRALPSREGHLQVSDLEIENANVTIHTITRKHTDGDKSSGTSQAVPSSLLVNPTPTPTIPPALAVTVDSATNPSPSPGTDILPGATNASPANTTNVQSSTDHQTEAQQSINTPTTLATEITAATIASGSSSDLDRVLDREADTLSRITSPPEDEVTMTMSRSASPAPTPCHSPPPSPPVSRCPSPVGITGSPNTGEKTMAPGTISDGIDSHTGLSAEPVPLGDNNDQEQGSTLLAAVAAIEPLQDHPDPVTENVVPNNTGPSTRRSTRAVKKTTKLMSMEETGKIQRGKKRQAAVLGDGNSIVNQERAVKRGKKRA